MGVQKKILTRQINLAVPEDSVGKAGALALGVPGNIYDASPFRIHTEELTNDADFGTYVDGKGVLVNPREAALVGKAGNPLAPSLTLSPGDAASFMTFGHVVVRCDEVSKISLGMNVVPLFGYEYTKVVATAGDTFVVVPDVADDFSTSTAYVTGDFVKYSGKIYCFKQDHTAGAWSGTDATDTSVVPDDDWPGDEADEGKLYKFYGDNVCVVELNGFLVS